MSAQFNFNKWLRSKNGRIAVIAVITVLLVAVAIYGGSQFLSGTAGLSGPAKGFTCLPTCDEADGRMFLVSGNEVASFGGNEVWVWIGIPSNTSSFTVDIFDGDAGKDSTGAYNADAGNWDPRNVQTAYTLYADPVQTGLTSSVVAIWKSEDMPNNAWYSRTVSNVPQAKAPNGSYFYLLKATRVDETKGWNAFKVRSSGFVSTGASSLTNSTFGVIASWSGYADFLYYFPNGVRKANGLIDITQLGTSPYNGDWNFSFFVPNKTLKLEIWDGDFDRGAAKVDISADTKDPNSPPRPEWATISTVDERAGGMGIPADNSVSPVFRRGVPVIFQVTDPTGNPIYVNENPSGTEEWERFVVSTLPDDPDADLITSAIEPGFYNMSIQGLDVSNSIYLRTNFAICDPDEGCGFTPWTEAACPRTIGYWKNNFKKVQAALPKTSGDKTPKGAQESQNSLLYGLNIVSQSSRIFRSELVFGTTVNISDLSGSAATPLTMDQGYTILMRGSGGKKVEYFTNLDRKTMLARALQQNLATWMNLATGKINGTAVVVIPLPDNPYEGSLIGALREAEDLILLGDEASLERAKNIADYINNNQFTEDSGDAEPAVESSEVPLECSVYNSETGSTPSDKQPPKMKDMPKAPKHESPEEVEVVMPICTAGGNTYTVENTTNNPFYSVKFNFASGTEVKEGGADTFKYTLPTDVVAGMTTMQVEAKAATDARIYDLACDFTNPLGCGEPTMDELYAVSFDGALDHGDGTATLSFTVYVKGQHGLSHVAFSLPEGQMAGGLDVNYVTEVCE